MTTYPLIMSDDAEQTVDHAACAVELATDILVDLFTFLSPPALYSRLFVFTASERKEWPMHSTNVRKIKAALMEQTFQGTTQARCPLGPVVVVSQWKGQLRVMIRGWEPLVSRGGREH